MASLGNLQDLLVTELQDLYNAENQIIKALPKMIKKASSGELRTAFQEHLQQTEQQVSRLEQAMGLLDVPVKGKKCMGMQGIIEEGKEMMEEDATDDVMDAALIAAAQKVEHYEIASYGSVRSYAGTLGLDQVQELLSTTLAEEEETDRKLTEIAEGLVNPEAAMASGDGSRGQGEEEEMTVGDDESVDDTMSRKQAGGRRKPATGARRGGRSN